MRLPQRGRTSEAFGTSAIGDHWSFPPAQSGYPTDMWWSRKSFLMYTGRMDLGIAGKVAMVAAASQGLGFAIAQALAAEGARVSMAARHTETIAAAARLAQLTGAQG